MSMGFWEKFKTDYRFVKTGIPGRRFRDYRIYKSVTPDPLTQRALMIGFALLLVIIGLAIGWLPGPGGFLSIIGLAMLAPYIPGVPYSLDKCELFVRRSWKFLLERFSSIRS